jgi:hypothetical protein
MSDRDQQGLTVGDSVVFDDAYTSETKYGRVERGYGCTFIVHNIVPRERAAPNPKPLTVRRPCSLVLQPDGMRVCGSHIVELVEADVQGEENPPGVGHIKAWACPVSGKQFLEAEGL